MNGFLFKCMGMPNFNFESENENSSLLFAYTRDEDYAYMKNYVLKCFPELWILNFYNQATYTVNA